MVDLRDYEKNVEWDLLKIDITTREERHKYNLDSTSKIISYHFILKRNWGIIRIIYVTPTLGMYYMYSQSHIRVKHNFMLR